MRTNTTILRKKINKSEIADLINKGIRPCDIYRYVGCSKAAFYRVRQELIDQGLV